MQKILLIDNYDSFTYNLYQYLGELDAHPTVYRNNEITIQNIRELEPTHIILSPGPGSVLNKEDFGVCDEVLKFLVHEGIRGMCIPLLGICLGHQGIIHHFGGEIIRAPEIVHGKPSEIEILENSILFKDIPSPFMAMRYHSQIGTHPDEDLKITAVLKSSPDVIMAVEHKTLPIYGVQFHPESIGTPEGKKLIRNFTTFPKPQSIR